jgi:hypothetical protein
MPNWNYPTRKRTGQVLILAGQTRSILAEICERAGLKVLQLSSSKDDQQAFSENLTSLEHSDYLITDLGWLSADAGWMMGYGSARGIMTVGVHASMLSLRMGPMVKESIFAVESFERLEDILKNVLNQPCEGVSDG